MGIILHDHSLYIQKNTSHVHKLFDFRQQQKLSPLVVMLAGGLAGMCSWATAIAPDTVKSRFQIGIFTSDYHALLLYLHCIAPEGKYRGVRDVFVELVSWP